MFLQENVSQSEGFVSQHHQFSDAYNQCREWVNMMQDRLEICMEPATDKHGIQGKLEKLEVGTWNHFCRMYEYPLTEVTHVMHTVFSSFSNPRDMNIYMEKTHEICLKAIEKCVLASCFCSLPPRIASEMHIGFQIVEGHL